MKINSFAEPRAEYRRLNLQELEPIVTNDWWKDETFEQFVTKKFSMYCQKTASWKVLKLIDCQQKYFKYSNTMGVKNKKIEEFESWCIDETIKLKIQTLKEIVCLLGKFNLKKLLMKNGKIPIGIIYQ
jgi:hypothetical protein